GTADVSLDDLKTLAPPRRLRDVTLSYLQKSLLQGAERFHLMSPKPSRLWGVEDPALYARSIELYRSVTASRERCRVFLGRLSSAVKTAEDKVLNPALLELVRSEESFEAGRATLGQHYAVLSRLFGAEDVSAEARGFLDEFERVQTLEAKIRFESAGEELAEASGLVASADGTGMLLDLNALTRDDLHRSGPKAARLRNELDAAVGPAEAKRRFGDLCRYLEYIEAVADLDMGSMETRRAAFVSRMTARLARTGAESRLVVVSRAVRGLERLINLSADPRVLRFFDDEPRMADPGFLTGAVNRMLMDLESGYEKAVFLDPAVGPVIQDAPRFYALTRQRDEVFIERMISKMDEEHASSAVLVAGGYHAPHLKEMLRRQGIGYVSIVPRVFHPTDHGRYERLLLSQEQAVPAGAVAAFRGGMARTLNLKPLAARPELFGRLARDLAGPRHSPLATAGSRLLELFGDAQLNYYQAVLDAVKTEGPSENSAGWLKTLLDGFLDSEGNNDYVKSRVAQFMADWFDPDPDAFLRHRIVADTTLIQSGFLVEGSSETRHSYLLQRNRCLLREFMRSLGPLIQKIRAGGPPRYQGRRIRVGMPGRVDLFHEATAADLFVNHDTGEASAVVNIAVNIGGSEAFVVRVNPATKFEGIAIDFDQNGQKHPPLVLQSGDDLNAAYAHSVMRYTAAALELTGLMDSGEDGGLFRERMKRFFSGALSKEGIGYRGMRIQIQSRIPPRSGLGGSTALAAAVTMALLLFTGRDTILSKAELSLIASYIEMMLIDRHPETGSMGGWQDALGPILAGMKLMIAEGGDVRDLRQTDEVSDPDVERALMNRSLFLGLNSRQGSSQGVLDGLIEAHLRRDEVYLLAKAEGKSRIRTMREMIHAYRRGERDLAGVVNDLEDMIGEERKGFGGVVPGYLDPDFDRAMRELAADPSFVDAEGRRIEFGYKYCGAGGGAVWILLKMVPGENAQEVAAKKSLFLKRLDQIRRHCPKAVVFPRLEASQGMTTRVHMDQGSRLALRSERSRMRKRLRENPERFQRFVRFGSAMFRDHKGPIGRSEWMAVNLFEDGEPFRVRFRAETAAKRSALGVYAAAPNPEGTLYPVLRIQEPGTLRRKRSSRVSMSDLQLKERALERAVRGELDRGVPAMTSAADRAVVIDFDLDWLDPGEAGPAFFRTRIVPELMAEFERLSEERAGKIAMRLTGRPEWLRMMQAALSADPAARHNVFVPG
ncbi:MAG: hypothetical protein HQL11_05470, partial [Candidatus Omnitrophica bacterium]|nr:hypothetical protein [Candidatus Omnitrophota bacterium]